MAVSRRDALKYLALSGAAAAGACRSRASAEQKKTPKRDLNVILSTERLGNPWKTRDPFLFCVHHDDHYPKGNEQFGPVASLSGRNIGSDFAGIDGWRMYHGDVVPGFPQHPHRGFETVTVVRRGLLDHSDSIGGAGRYGGGDVQWMTAGRGIQHAEMFPLLNRAGPNPLELFQIWLNLPARQKMVDPHYSMLWRSTIPQIEEPGVKLSLVAGRYGSKKAPAPPPDSWASLSDSDVAIWTIRMAPNTQWALPKTDRETNRTLYYFSGAGLSIGGQKIESYHEVQLRPESIALLESGPVESELLLLQGRPISERVVKYGPFVMNSEEEIRQAFSDYRQTGFGGWPWKENDPVHGREEGRFARYIDGRIERPTT